MGVNPKRLVHVRSGIFDPDPEPNPFPIAILLLGIVGALGIALWTNPGMVNNLMIMLNPEVAKETEENRKAMLDTMKYILIITALICLTIALFYYWRYSAQKREEKRLMRKRRRLVTI